MRNWNGWWIVIIILLLIDFYVFFAVKFLAHNNSDKSRIVIYSLYWALSAFAIIFILSFPKSDYLQRHVVFRNYAFAIIVGLFFAKLVASVFFLLDDVRRLFVWLMAKIFPKTGVDFTHESSNISRSAFLSWT
jgi:hypothetical protein